MRHTIIIAVCSAITATAISFAVAQAGGAPAKPAATDRPAVRQLRAVNRNLSTISQKLSSLDRSVNEVETKVGAVETAVGTSEFNGMRGELREYLGSTILGSTVRGLLHEICKNTGTSSASCF